MANAQYALADSLSLVERTQRGNGPSAVLVLHTIYVS